MPFGFINIVNQPFGRYCDRTMQNYQAACIYSKFAMLKVGLTINLEPKSVLLSAFYRTKSNNIFVSDIMKFGFKERGNRQHGDQQPGAPSHVSDVSRPRHVCHKSRDLTARRPRVLSHRSNSLLLLLIFLFCLPASYSTDPNKLKVKFKQSTYIVMIVPMCNGDI